MPFCRECGKEVQDDWLTCPFCSSSLPQTSQNISLQDSVMSGDINFQQTQNITNINDSKSECPACGSIGATMIACVDCKEIYTCSICEDEIEEEKLTMFCYEYDASKHYTNQVSLDDEKIFSKETKKLVEDYRLCYQCLQNRISSEYLICKTCNKFLDEKSRNSLINYHKKDLTVFQDELAELIMLGPEGYEWDEGFEEEIEDYKIAIEGEKAVIDKLEKQIICSFCYFKGIEENRVSIQEYTKNSSSELEKIQLEIELDRKEIEDYKNNNSTQWTDINGNTWRKFPNGSIEWWNGTDWQWTDN